MAFQKILFLFFSFEIFTRGEVPEDYILHVTPTCGANAVEDAKVEILTDLHIHAKAECNGNTVSFVSDDRVHHDLSVSYPGGKQPCLFKKRKDSEVYSIKVIVSYGETGRFVHQKDEEFTVSCTFTPRAMNETGGNDVLNGLIAAEEIQENAKGLTDALIDLKMTTVAGGDLSGVQVHLGRIVKLTAKASKTAEDEVGLRPVSCVAISVNTTYAILRSGCGDGIVFKQTDGFKTAGLVAQSPLFEAFSLGGATDLTFQCNFTMCADNCDGICLTGTANFATVDHSSCVQPKRQRRNAFDRPAQETVEAMPAGAYMYTLLVVSPN